MSCCVDPIYTYLHFYQEIFFTIDLKKQPRSASKIYSGAVTTQPEAKRVEPQGLSIHLPRWNQGIIDMLWGLQLL